MKANNYVVALSGGVDSSVCVSKLLDEGHNVTCVHVKSWDSFANNDKEGILMDCGQGADYNDACKVAKSLGVKIQAIDLTKEYWSKVFDSALESLKKGLTPNPDNFCNRFIKFGELLKYVKKNYPGYIMATGHYASINQKSNLPTLNKALDEDKDQTYFLSRVKYESLKNVCFPLGKIPKSEVRKIAKEKGLHTFNKKDSTGICFVGERRFEDFLQNYLEVKEGKIIDFDSNKEIGKHKGYYFYTIGQNSNLNLGGQKERKAVYKKDIKNNIIYVLGIKDERHFSDNFSLTSINILGDEKKTLLESKNLKVKIRHQGKEVDCKTTSKEKLDFKLSKKLKAITPGQEAVFYINERCIGGGTISKVW